MNKLFELSYEQLRNNFVRGRFAEEKIFGRADIEEWLKEQRKAKSPFCMDSQTIDWDKYWNNDGKTLSVAGREFEVLRKYSSYVYAGLPSDAEKEQCLAYQKIYPLIEPFNREVYLGMNFGPIIFLPNEEIKMVVGSEEKDVILSFELTSPVVIDALLAEWYYGREKAAVARQFLCDTLAADVAVQRKQAEDDFDRAVAVSADGKEILCADWVIVFQGNEPFNEFGLRQISICKTSQFNKDKIKLSTVRRSSMHPARDLTEQYSETFFVNFLRYFADSLESYDQAFYHIGNQAVPVFITKESFCSHWPEDGHVVTL
jgi:hypothetical protein